MVSLRVSAVVVAACLVSSCAGKTPLEAAADELDPPAEFVEIERVLGNFLQGKDNARRDQFSTELSQVQACELGAATLAEWAGKEVTEVNELNSPFMCRYVVRNPRNHRALDLAAVEVRRAELADGLELDETKPGGVASVLFFFMAPTYFAR